MSVLGALTACRVLSCEGNGVPVFTVVLIHCFTPVPLGLHLHQMEMLPLRTGPSTFRQAEQILHMEELLRNVYLGFVSRVPISSFSDFLS